MLVGLFKNTGIHPLHIVVDQNAQYSFYGIVSVFG